MKGGKYQNPRFILNVSRDRKRCEVEAFQGIEKGIRRVCFDVVVRYDTRPYVEDEEEQEEEEERNVEAKEEPTREEEDSKATTEAKDVEQEDKIEELPVKKAEPTLDYYDIYQKLARVRDCKPIAQLSDQLRQVRRIQEPIPLLFLENQAFQRDDLHAVCDVLSLILRRVGCREFRYVDNVVSSDPDAPPSDANDVKLVLGSIMASGGVERLSIRWPRQQQQMDRWRALGYFVHMSPSLRHLDLSGAQVGVEEASMLAVALSTPYTGSSPTDPSKRFPPLAVVTSLPSSDSKSSVSTETTQVTSPLGIESLSLAECVITPEILNVLKPAFMKHVRMLSLASSNGSLPDDCMQIVAEMIANEDSSIVEIDFSNNDLSGDKLVPFISTFDKAPAELVHFYILKMANCNLIQSTCLPAMFDWFTRLPNMRYLDLNDNALFTNKQIAKQLLTALPKMKILRRIHLAGNNISPISLVDIAHIIPDCANIAHLDVVRNPVFESLPHDEGSPDLSGLTALLAASRLSKSIVAVSTDRVPPSDEAIRMSRRILGHCIRNMERDSSLYEGDLLEASRRKRAATGTSVPIDATYSVDGGHGIARALETFLDGNVEPELKEISKVCCRCQDLRLIVYRICWRVPEGPKAALFRFSCLLETTKCLRNALRSSLRFLHLSSLGSKRRILIVKSKKKSHSRQWVICPLTNKILASLLIHLTLATMKAHNILLEAAPPWPIAPRLDRIPSLPYNQDHLNLRRVKSTDLVGCWWRRIS